MKSTITLLLLVGACQISFGQKSATLRLKNETGQQIKTVKYFAGTELQCADPGKKFKSKAGLEYKDTINIPLSFDSRKDRKVIIKAELEGGGETAERENTFEKGEKQSQKISIRISTGDLPKNPLKEIYEQFRKFELTTSYINLNAANAFRTVIGAVFIYNSKNEVVDILLPDELKSTNLDIQTEGFDDKISSIFSKETAIQAGVKAPFVTVESEFTNNELALFTWEVKSAGPIVWQAVGGKNVQTLFSELQPSRLDGLYQTYINSGRTLTAKFMNRAYLIKKIAVKRQRSIQLTASMKIDVSSFVTANGNFKISNENSESSTVENIVTSIDGYYVTHLLQNLAISRETNLANLKVEYELYRQKYPELLPELPANADASLIKRLTTELSTKLNGNLTLLKQADVKLQEVVVDQKVKGVGDIIQLITEEKKPEDPKPENK